jgi:hypothetical protein
MDAFAEGHLQRDFRERAAARPYLVGGRGWIRRRWKNALKVQEDGANGGDEL